MYLYGYDGPVNVSIDMSENSSLTVSYPEYKNGWCVDARPDGTLTDNNRTYPYLYYEAIIHHQFDMSEGFCVARDDLVDFLEEKLSILGLTDKEQADFITYWLPQLSKKDYAVVSFASKEYDNLVAGCDVGLVFLDNRFTIPNYPSRILSYMENEMPMIVCTDAATDVGFDAYYNGYGFCCTADDPKAFTECIDKMTHDNIKSMGDTARKYLESYFTSEKCYAIIKSHWNTVNK